MGRGRTNGTLEGGEVTRVRWIGTVEGEGDLQCVAPIWNGGREGEGRRSERGRRTYTRATVLDGPVGTGELSEVVAGHFRLDLDGVEDLQTHTYACTLSAFASESHDCNKSTRKTRLIWEMG